MTTDFYLTDLMTRQWDSQYGVEYMSVTFLRTIGSGLVSSLLSIPDGKMQNAALIFCEIELHNPENFTFNIYYDGTLIRKYISIEREITCYFEEFSRKVYLNETIELELFVSCIIKNKDIICNG